MKKFIAVILMSFVVSGVRADDCRNNNNPQSACNRPDNITGGGDKSGISGTEYAILAAGVVAVGGLFIWHKTDWFKFGAAPMADGGLDFRFRQKF